MSKRVAIVQSNYIPWRGYFDLIRSTDVFVLYDTAQYTVRDWRNRNRIKTRHGLKWLTIPVEDANARRPIRDMRVSDPTWAERHWRTLAHSYADAAQWRAMRQAIEPLFRECRSEYLSEINYRFLTGLCPLLGIEPTLRWSSEFAAEGDRTGRLVTICRALNADVYVSGPSAREYLDEAQFTAQGMTVQFFDYAGYPEYPQPFPPFEPQVSVIDLIVNTGIDAPAYLRRHP